MHKSLIARLDKPAPGPHPRRAPSGPGHATSLVALLILFALLALGAHAGTLVHRFEGDPIAAGWQPFGQTNLFAWNASEETLHVTWDSAQPNSYYALPLGRTLSRTNDFLLAFDLRLSDITVGTTEDKPFTFQIAIGLIHHTQTTNTALARGSGSAPNLVEFDYFPNDSNDFGATVSTALISSSTNYWSGGFTSPLELGTNAVYRVQLLFRAATQTLESTLLSNGVPVGPLADATIGPGFGDFQVDTLAICSYSDEGQFPGFEGSVLAHGEVDNVAFASPLPVGALRLQPAPGEVALLSDTNWLYTLETSGDLRTWTASGPTVPGTGSLLVLSDPNPSTGFASYRVRAALP